MIYLRCPLKTLRRRIARRGRDMERTLPTDYLRSLEQTYDDWIARYTLSPVLTFETDRLDPITDLVDCKQVFDAVERYL
jgi:deoxyadenosine/deoxycytidine kinase